MKVYKSKRKYKCPYCDKSFLRGDLVTHISEEHEEMIPEGYTAARVVFNYLNDTDHGICQSCGEPTDWNEDKWIYDPIHQTEKCIKIAREKALRNHMKAFNGKKTLLNDPAHQAKMLEGRSISGEYAFSNGEKMSYTGSYEKRFLEFCDQILHLVPNVEIFNIDGNNKEFIIYYTYKGKKHFWIPDYYIKPFNLMIDVKDGGNNKNNRSMPEYREKQKCKEDAISKQGKFNYLRLTDNQFSQLFDIFLDIKFSLIDNNPTKIHINEYAGCSCGGHPVDRSLYIVPYTSSGEIIDGYGVMENILSKDIFVSTDHIDKVDAREFLKDKKYNVIEINTENAEEILNSIYDMYSENTETNPFTLFNMFKNIKSIQEVYNGSDMFSEIDNNIYNIYNEYTILEECIDFPILDKTIDCSNITDKYTNLIVKEDVNGYFVENVVNHNRSISYVSVNSIQPCILHLINSLEL